MKQHRNKALQEILNRTLSSRQWEKEKTPVTKKM
jgi:hypothetical protein